MFGHLAEIWPFFHYCLEISRLKTEIWSYLNHRAENQKNGSFLPSNLKVQKKESAIFWIFKILIFNLLVHKIIWPSIMSSISHLFVSGMVQWVVSKPILVFSFVQAEQ